jgi:hypothetical protein
MVIEFEHCWNGLLDVFCDGADKQKLIRLRRAIITVCCTGDINTDTDIDTDATRTEALDIGKDIREYVIPDDINTVEMRKTDLEATLRKVKPAGANWYSAHNKARLAINLGAKLYECICG